MDGRKKHVYELTDGSENSCARVDGSENSCAQTKEVLKPCGRKSSCVGVWKNGGVEIISNSQRNRMCLDADVKPIVRDPMSEDRILVESGAEMTLAGPSEFEKLKHHLTHIPFQPWCTSCVKGKAQAGTTQTNRAHHRRQRTPSDTM